MFPLSSSYNLSLPTSTLTKRNEKLSSRSIPSNSSSTSDVYLRINPCTAETDEECYAFPNSTNLLVKKSDHIDKKFNFTRIFDAKSSQADIFEQCTRQKIVNFILGENSTIVTYGSCNSGKTYTLHGTPESPGIVPRSIEFLFSTVISTLSPCYKITDDNLVVALNESERMEKVEQEDPINSKLIGKEEYSQARLSLYNSVPDASQLEDRENCTEGAMFSVWISFAEIYNENVYDLLAANEQERRPLKMATQKDGTTFIKGLKAVYVITALEALQLLILAQSRMTVGNSKQKLNSSRSHTFVIIKLLKYNRENALNDVQASTLTFCDLAASGRSKESHKSGVTLTETRCLNNSLLVLGRCLKAVRDSHLNRDQYAGLFRESKLTRILQKTLTNQEKICFIFTINVQADLLPETLSVLKVSTIARKLGVESRELKQDSVSERSLHSPKTPTSVGSSFKTSKNLISIHMSEYEALKRENNELKKEVESLKMSMYEHDAASVKLLGNTQSDSTFLDCKALHERNEGLMKSLEDLEHDRVNRELEIRQELANQHAIDIEELEAAWKKRVQEVEDEAQDLLKWSVNQMESFYKVRIDNILHNRKKRRNDDGDYTDEARSIYEQLERENELVTSKVAVLKKMVQNLRSKNQLLGADRNTCYFELALVREELKEFDEFIRTRFPELFLHSEDGKCDVNGSVHGLRRISNEKNDDIEVFENDFSQTNDSQVEVFPTSAKIENDCNAETLLQEVLCRLEGRENELREKMKYIQDLELEIQSLKEEFSTVHAETKSKNSNNSIRKYSSAYSDDFFNNPDTSNIELITQAHVDFRKQRYIDKNSPRKEISLNNSDPNMGSCFTSTENGGSTFRFSDGNPKEDSGIDSTCKSERSISFNDSLTTQDVKENSAEIPVYVNDQISAIQEKTESQSTDRSVEDDSKTEKLEKELSKILELNERDGKTAVTQGDLFRVQQLYEKVNELETVHEKWQEEKNNYRKRLQEQLETQLTLETKLKWLSAEIQCKDDELISLKTEIGNMMLANTVNREETRNLSRRIGESNEIMCGLKCELSYSEKLRKLLEKKSKEEISNLQSRLAAFATNTDFMKEIYQQHEICQQIEIEKLREQFFEKERENCLFKEHRDTIVKKYEKLIGELQMEIDERNEQLSKLKNLLMPNFTKNLFNFSGKNRRRYKVSRIPRLAKKGRRISKLSQISRQSDDGETVSLISKSSIAQQSRKQSSVTSSSDEILSSSSVCRIEESCPIGSDSELNEAFNSEMSQTQSGASDCPEVCCACNIGFRRARSRRGMSGWMGIRRNDEGTKFSRKFREAYVRVNVSDSES